MKRFQGWSAVVAGLIASAGLVAAGATAARGARAAQQRRAARAEGGAGEAAAGAVGSHAHAVVAAAPARTGGVIDFSAPPVYSATQVRSK